MYQYNEEANTTAFSVEGGLTTGYFFNEAGFGATIGSNEEEKGKQRIANGSQVCVQDMYKSRYEILFVRARLMK